MLNGASDNLIVNGSVTPVNFDFTPASGETWYLEGLQLVFSDSAAQTPAEFANLTALTNGVDVLVRTNGTEYTLTNLKNNSQVLQFFHDNKIIHLGSSNFFNVDGFTGDIHFPIPMTLQNSTSDYVRVQIRDNLTGMDYFTIRVTLWRVV